ncbi:hypothetical protein BGX31_001404 [Mortierella sp. GBA43]|nr:hypothetical protein BGX31_001404 [Mortierella sp. GBA43]
MRKYLVISTEMDQRGFAPSNKAYRVTSHELSHIFFMYRSAPSLLEEARAGAGAGAGAGTGTGSGQKSARDRGERGGARGRGRGRGRGRPEEVAATASGPFSLGPAVLARSRQIITSGTTSGAHSSYTGLKTVKVEGDTNLSGDDRDYYGTGAVDMKFGSVTTDASVPTGLERASPDAGQSAEMKMKMDMDEDHDDKTFEEADAEVYEDGVDIKPKLEGPAHDLCPPGDEDQLYFFQFPSVMPAFKPKPVTQSQLPSIVSSSASSPGLSSMYNGQEDSEKMEYTEDGLLAVKSEPIDVDRPNLIQDDNDHGSVKAEKSDIKLGLGSTSNVPVGQRAKPKVAASGDLKAEAKDESEEGYVQEGKIGRLLIYKSGKVKMQVGDIIMDVSSGSECSFLQEVVVVDTSDRQAFVMGAVEKRMICVPNLTHLLSGVEGMDI